MMLAKPQTFDLVAAQPSCSAQQLFELHLVAGYVNPDIQGMWEIFLDGGEG